MAFCITSFPKYSASSIINRSIKLSDQYIVKTGICVRFSTSQIMKRENSAAVKFSTNKAAKIPISETIGLKSPTSKLWYKKYVVIVSLLSFLLYFCVFRKENDIDEILKGNSDYSTTKLELIKLKTQLKFCEANQLPVVALKAKIEELEEKEKVNKSYSA